MPISAELGKLLDLISDPVEREARMKELTELSEGSLRQADYSRKMNELAETRKTQEAIHAKNLAWYDRANKQYSTLESEYKAAQERIAAIESAQGHGSNTEGDERELEKQLAIARKEAAEANKRIGELDSTVKTFNQMVSDGKLITADKLDERLNASLDSAGAAVLDIFDLQTKHQREYGTELDRNTLIMEAQKLGGDLKKAYEVVTAKDRETKLRKDIEADVEKRWAEKMKNSQVPYAQGGEPVVGPLQARLQKKDTGIPDEVQADGSGRLANLIGAELRQEGKM